MIWNFWRAIFFKGEAISSSIPSIIIFFQNIPKNDFFCQNSSQTSYIVSSPQLNFSVSTYFGSIGLFVLICLLSFIILDQRRAKNRTLSNKIVLIEANNLNENEEFIQQEPINSNSKEKTFLLIIIFFLSFLMVSQLIVFSLIHSLIIYKWKKSETYE